MLLEVFLIVLALVAGYRLGKRHAPQPKVIHHSDKGAVYDAYLKGMNDYEELFKDAVQQGYRLSRHPKNRSVLTVLDPRIPDIVGEVHFNKKCNYRVEMFIPVAAKDDRPANIPADFIKVWDPALNDYTWQQPA